MKILHKIILPFVLVIFLIPNLDSYSQVFSTNRNPVGMENNLLFSAQERFSVTQSGSGQVYLDMLFDGSYNASYSTTGISTSDPTIITIEGLPSGYHTQAGSWVGWTTRYWPARRFKIEAFDTYYANGWTIIADYTSSDFNGYDFSTTLSGVITKLRFTFTEGTGDGGRFGLSEIFFIHPEATTPYSGLFKVFKSISEVNNNILIGKIQQANTAYKLDVNGKIRADEVIVNTTGADFVFDPSYNLPELEEIEKYINDNKHLPDFAPASKMKEDGMCVGEMQTKLLQKIEEMTLYMIELKKENIQQAEQITILKKEMAITRQMFLKQ